VSRLSDIVDGLEHLLQHYREWGIASLAVPPLGCGNGQLEWRVVGPTLYRHLRQLGIPVELYGPHGVPEEQLSRQFLAGGGEGTDGAPDAPGVGAAGESGRVPPAWVALVAILDRIHRERYHWPVGRTAFQKIAYFATESGLPTGLRHVRGSYGPFSADVKPLLTTLVNNGLVQEAKLGRMLSLRPGPTYRDAARAFGADLARWEPIIDRIADLFLRMRTHDAEVAASVYFAARALSGRTAGPPSEMEVLDEVRRWKQRRRPPLTDGEIAEAVRGLNALRWLSARHSPELPLPEEAVLDP
jgi:hypothetical protein